MSTCRGALAVISLHFTHPIIAKPLDPPLFAARKEGEAVYYFKSDFPGYGRYHYKENRNFCYFSRGSIIETKSWLKKAKIRKLITEEQFDILYEKLQTIHLKLNAYLKFIGKSGNRSDQ